MAIAEQFAGLQMDQLIGAPLRAAADASIQLAESTADFIRKVGFDQEGKARTATFGYQRFNPGEGGVGSLEEMRVDIPLLAVVPIPNLQVDEVNLLFDIEVKQSERRDSAMELSAGASGKLGALKVGITGNISAHQANTRSTDNSAKYHVDIRAANHGIPEGLARVLDMMAANMTPMLADSSLRDENGRVLSGQAQIRAERLTELRLHIDRTERRLRAAREGLDVSLQQLRKQAAAQLNVYKENMSRLQERLEELTDQVGAGEGADRQDPQVRQQALAYLGAMETVRQSWETFAEGAGEHIRLLADSRQTQAGKPESLALKALDARGNVAAYTDGEIYYEELAEAQENALENQRSVNRLEEELLAARAQYSQALGSGEDA